jgi:hypothetical protein
MTRRSRWPLFVGIGGFLIFASTFLYFFVDDEGIPFVFAQNLLHHKGLTYSAFEGPVEGYSDFLHVWLATGLLAITQALGAPKLTVFFIGKAISLVAGVLTIVWADRLLRASPEIDGDGRAVGVMFLALAGPLAVWSCSSLEAATFGAIVTLLLYALFAPAPPWTDRLACTAAILAILERIDGFIHVAVLVGVACIIASPERRRALARRIVLPVALVLVAYHLGRRWYFGEWFSTPMLVKVLDNLHPRGVMISKTPDRNYLASFLASTGWLMPIGAPAVLIALHRRRRMMALLLATLAMCGYLALVGDWMFGFRFFVPLLPWFAVLLAAAVSALIRRWPIARPWLVAAVLIAIASNAFRFEQAYHDSDDRRLLRADVLALRDGASHDRAGRDDGVQPGGLRPVHARRRQHRRSRGLLALHRPSADQRLHPHRRRPVRAADQQAEHSRGARVSALSRAASPDRARRSDPRRQRPARPGVPARQSVSLGRLR